jgi:hypothetical protein
MNICCVAWGKPPDGRVFVDIDAWTVRYFSSIQNVERPTARLHLPDVWTRDEIRSNSHSKNYLFPGVGYRPPEKLPLGIAADGVVNDVESSLITNNPKQSILNSLIIGRRFVSQNEYDLKDLINDSNDPDRYVLEDAVNFNFGRAMVIMGYSPGEIKILAGLAAIGTYALNGRFLPYGGLFSTTGGDDPLGWTNIALGVEYQISGQYMYDFFSERGATPGPNFGKIPAWQESLSRLQKQVPTDEISKIIKSTELRRRAIERASETGITTQQALREVKAEERTVGSARAPVTHESVDRLWMMLQMARDAIERAEKREAERKQRARENSERSHGVDMQVRLERIREQRERTRDKEIRERQDQARETQEKRASEKEKKAKDDADKRGRERPPEGNVIIFGPKN